MCLINAKSMSKLTLKGYYETLGNPQKNLRERIATECGVTTATVFRWLSGEIVPDKLKREKIAEIIGVGKNGKNDPIKTGEDDPQKLKSKNV